MTQKLAGSDPCTFTGFESYFTIDDDLLIARSPLHTSPFAPGQVVFHITNPVRQNLQLLHVINQDIGRGTFSQSSFSGIGPTVASAC